MSFLYDSLKRVTEENSFDPGDSIRIKPDLILAHDGSWPKIYKKWKDSGLRKEIDSDFVITIDHAFPAPTIEDRVMHKQATEVCTGGKCTVFSHGEGNLHQIVAEKFRPEKGSVIVGADGHVATSGAFGAIAFSVGADELVSILETGYYNIKVPEVITFRLGGKTKDNVLPRDIALYILGNYSDELNGKAVSFKGEYFDNASSGERMTICNLMPEGGAVTAFISDEENNQSDQVIDLNVAEITQMVAVPPKPTNVKTAEELEGTLITTAIIGGCSSGRTEDMEIAASVLNGRKIDENVTLIVTPASMKVANEMDEKGITEILRNAGGVIMPPGCGPCPGKHFGLLAPDDVAITTTIRNSSGRIGDKESSIYLASPYTVAMAALKGKI